MDEIVKQALAKWPNVPHCTGWLLLDRRGQWRMRDEAAQAAGALGDAIRHEALIGFINRNYERDPDGQWFFQNGRSACMWNWLIRRGSCVFPRWTAHCG